MLQIYDIKYKNTYDFTSLVRNIRYYGMNSENTMLYETLFGFLALVITIEQELVSLKDACLYL
jgi:hypothetical protein